jgi:hypothetical protein
MDPTWGADQVAAQDMFGRYSLSNSVNPAQRIPSWRASEHLKRASIKHPEAGFNHTSLIRRVRRELQHHK